MAVEIRYLSSFERALSDLSPSERVLVLAAMAQLAEDWGQPHVHSGLSVRALRPSVYECRASQALRILFTRHGNTLLLRTVGDHRAIRRWLKNNA